jgi:hypothetical protein
MTKLPERDATLVQATTDLVAHAKTNPALAHTLRQFAQALLEVLPAPLETIEGAKADVNVNAGFVHVYDERGVEGDDVQRFDPHLADSLADDNERHDGADEDGADEDGADGALVVVPEPASAADIDHLLASFGDPKGNAASEKVAVAADTAYDAGRIAPHLRLKARACRWLEHHALTNDTAALDERYQLIYEAKAEACLLWMFNRDYVNPQNLQLADVAGLLDLLADAVLLWEDGYNEPEGRDIAQLVATVQSALRIAVSAVNSQDNWFDSDQKAVYQELTYYGEREQHYLQHMRLNDGASPSEQAYYRQQLNALQALIDSRRAADKQRQSQRNKLRYHVAKVLEQPQNASSQWQSLLASLAPFWQGDDDNPHLPADIRDDVRPILALQDAPRLTELDDEERDWLETISTVFEHPVASRKKDAEAASKTPDVQRDTAISDDVKRLVPHFTGRTIVIIGGDPKPHNSAVLEQHFNCRVDWIKTTAHQSFYTFAPKLIRDDVVLVALLIRWSSHIFGEVKSLCDEHHKHLVRLPRGYGVNMFAHEVLGQIGEKLEAKE